jgi:hypothetical protein
MGAGKGKARRTQTLTDPGSILKRTLAKAAETNAGTTVKVNVDKWSEFVHDKGIRELQVEEYYKLENYDESQYRDHDVQMEFVTKIFADAVAAGAITLPKPYKAKDFKLKATSRENAYGDLKAVKATVCLKSNPEKVAKFKSTAGFAYHLITPFRYVEETIANIAAAIEELV